MNKSKVGIYRTAYPLYSETFITEQFRNFETYQAVVLCRDLHAQVQNFKVLRMSAGFFQKISFTLLGNISGFMQNPISGELKLIHAHFAPDACLILPLAKKLHIPLIVSCHGSDITVSDGYLLKSLKISAYRYLVSRKYLQKHTAIFLAVSDFLRSQMIQKGFPENKVIRHYIGVDIDKFIPKNSETTVTNQSDTTYFLSVARHTEVKGIDVLLRAFSIVVRQDQHIRLIQIGAGDLTQELKALTIALGIEDRVEFKGVQTPEQVLSYIQCSKAMILSSRKTQSGAEESFGLVLAEAASCAKACIGTRVGGIPEAIIDGVTGFIVEPDNPQDLSEKMLRLINEPDLCMKMGEQGRAMVCENFNLKKQTRLLENIYTSLI